MAALAQVIQSVQWVRAILRGSTSEYSTQAAASGQRPWAATHTNRTFQGLGEVGHIGLKPTEVEDPSYREIQLQPLWRPPRSTGVRSTSCLGSPSRAASWET